MRVDAAVGPSEEELSHGEPGTEDVIAGRQPVREALKAGRPLHRLLLRQGLEERIRAELTALAREQGVPVHVVDGRKLDTLADGLNHQGVVAIGLAKGYVELDDLLKAVAGGPATLLLLDGVQDPQNVGSLLRSADAAGVAGLIIPRRRAAGLTSAVGRASAGAIEYVPVARVGNLVQTMERLKEEGFWIVGADADGDQVPWEVDMTGCVALVVGGEGAGLGRLVRQRCDHVVRIPMQGRVASLNAAVAGALLMFEVVRQRWLESKGDGSLS